MKTQKIVLALALAAVTPAVLAAQENGNAYNKSTNEVIASNNQQASSLYVGPGSKIGYIADNALTRIRTKHQSKKQNEPTEKQEKKTSPQVNVAADAYRYGGPDGHALLAGENLSARLSARRQQRKAEKQKQAQQVKTTDTVPVKRNNTTPQTSNDYNQYVGPEGHRAAGFGNAVRDAKHDSTTVPTHVKDIDTVARNHQVTLNSKTAENSAKKSNGNFRQWIINAKEVIAEALIQDAQEARYSK